MTNPLPLLQDEYFETVSHQGKTLAVGDKVIVNHAGQLKEVTVSSIYKKQGHYWIGYDDNRHNCPWPLVQPTHEARR